MTTLPQEYVDAFVAFAFHETSWDHWPRWFAMNAAKLCRVMDRDEFRLIRADPNNHVPKFLAANGIAFTCRDPFYTESPRTGSVTDTEYSIYTSLFRTELFAFDHGHTSIDDQTGIVGIHRQSFSVNTISESFDQPIHDAGELFASFCSRNGHRYPLRPQFDVANGYALGESSDDGGAFIISRAATNRSQTIAVVYIGYFGGPLVGAGYLVSLANPNGTWQLGSHTPLWVS